MGGRYYYKVNDLRANKLCGDFFKLKEYLNNLFKTCPDDYFNSGPRSSCLRFKLPNLKLITVKGHRISQLTRLALKNDYYGDEHLNVQAFMLEHDNETIAAEVPIWLKADELNNFKNLFKTNKVLTGHIDILSLSDDKIWIWDYKPKAHKEKFAATQVYFYALMLSKRTNIDLENFRCGYFDKNYAFLFKPEEGLVSKNHVLSRFYEKTLYFLKFLW